MALVKTTPMVPSAKRDVEAFVDRFFHNPFAAVEFAPLARMAEGFSPPFDLIENEKEYVVRLEVPGIPRENLDVNLLGDTITLTGHREKMDRKNNESILWEERDEGRFTRTIKLPQAIDPSRIEATCQDGMLTVHLPKLSPAVKSRIVIKS